MTTKFHLSIKLLLGFLLFHQSPMFAQITAEPTHKTAGRTHHMYVKADGTVGCTDDDHIVQTALPFYDPHRMVTGKQTTIGVGEPQAVAASTFIVTYTGFTTQAQTAFQYAVDLWSTWITSSVPIRVNANFTSLGANVLGSAGANLYRGLTVNGATSWYPDALADKLIGYDLGSSAADINANFSNTFNFYFGTDGNCPAGQYDFVSIVLHELGHGLGFAGSGRANSNSSPCTGAANQGCSGLTSGGTTYPVIFDRVVKDGANNLVFGYTNPSTTIYNCLISNDIYWHGTTVMAKNGGNKVKLYAPVTYTPGSTYSHWDESTFPAGHANSLMTPQIGAGEAIQVPGTLGCALMQDLGWTMAGYCANAILPIQLTDFKAVKQDKGILLQWKTQSEKENAWFKMERSRDGKTFIEINKVQGAGTSNHSIDYDYLDQTPWNGINYYRLRDVSTNGKTNLSSVVAVSNVSEKDWYLQPNPVFETLTVSFTMNLEQSASISIMDMLGRTLLIQDCEIGIGMYKLNLSQLPAGQYIVRAGNESYKRFVKL